MLYLNLLQSYLALTYPDPNPNLGRQGHDDTARVKIQEVRRGPAAYHLPIHNPHYVELWEHFAAMDEANEGGETNDNDEEEEIEMISQEEDVARAVVESEVKLTKAQKWASRVVRFGRDGLRKPPVYSTTATSKSKSTSKRIDSSTTATAAGASSSNSKFKTDTANLYKHHTKAGNGANHSAKKTTSANRNLRHKWAGALAAYLFRLKPSVLYSNHISTI